VSGLTTPYGPADLRIFPGIRHTCIGDLRVRVIKQLVENNITGH
jgi:hypothetical protein